MKSQGCSYVLKQSHGTKQNHSNWMGGSSFRAISHKIKHHVWVKNYKNMTFEPKCNG
jgi:hypothetical protein